VYPQAGAHAVGAKGKQLMTVPELPAQAHDTRTILGIRFFQGSASEAVQATCEGGLVIVPAAPALKDITTNPIYREALLTADFVLADSAFMVLVWNFLQRDHVTRLSGLGYLRELLQAPGFRQPGNTVWVMPTPLAKERALHWLAKQGIEVPEGHVYLAPMYDAQADGHIVDPELLVLLERLRPRHVVLAIGGGTQEPLGLSLRQRLSYLPAIHCIGAAIAFLSGDQVLIPVWADAYYLGWLFRTLAQPRRFAKRYWEARKLFTLLNTYRERLPEMMQ
jgi:UDP-N-acetyl-D-mannosaminuronic acid transferase (WecB/TagA/CpsF family)